MTEKFETICPAEIGDKYPAPKIDHLTPEQLKVRGIIQRAVKASFSEGTSAMAGGLNTLVSD